MQTVNITNELDERFRVDPETGEIIDSDPSLTVDLPLVARRMRELSDSIESFNVYRTEELNRIAESCDAKIDRLNKQMLFWQNQAEVVMTKTGEKKIEYPGLGTFKYVKSRDRVVTEKYDVAGPAVQQAIQADEPEWFNVKTTVTPDKKTIKNLLKNADHDNTKILDYFSIKNDGEKLTFKPE